MRHRPKDRPPAVIYCPVCDSHTRHDRFIDFDARTKGTRCWSCGRRTTTKLKGKARR